MSEQYLCKEMDCKNIRNTNAMPGEVSWLSETMEQKVSQTHISLSHSSAIHSTITEMEFDLKHCQKRTRPRLLEINKLQKLEDAQGETQTTRRTQETGFTGDTTDQKKSKKYFYFLKKS